MATTYTLMTATPTKILPVSPVAVAWAM